MKDYDKNRKKFKVGEYVKITHREHMPSLFLDDMEKYIGVPGRVFGATPNIVGDTRHMCYEIEFLNFITGRFEPDRHFWNANVIKKLTKREIDEIKWAII